MEIMGEAKAVLLENPEIKKRRKRREDQWSLSGLRCAFFVGFMQTTYINYVPH